MVKLSNNWEESISLRQDRLEREAQEYQFKLKRRFSSPTPSEKPSYSIAIGHCYDLKSSDSRKRSNASMN